MLSLLLSGCKTYDYMLCGNEKVIKYGYLGFINCKCSGDIEYEDLRRNSK